MRGNVLLAAALLLPTIAQADDIRFAAGAKVSASVTLVADSSGVLQLDRSQPITIGAVATVTKPTPPAAGERTATIRKLANAINDPVTSANLDGMYTALASRVRTGVVTTEAQLEMAVKSSVDFLLADPTRAAAWKPVRDQVNAYWVRMAQEGATLDQYADLLNEVAAGVSEPNQALDFAAISKLIDLVLTENKTPADFIVMAMIVIQIFAL